MATGAQAKATRASGGDDAPSFAASALIRTTTKTRRRPIFALRGTYSPNATPYTVVGRAAARFRSCLCRSRTSRARARAAG